MSPNQYQAQELSNLLENIQAKQASGVLYIDAQVDSEKPAKSRVLIWKDGRTLYGGKTVPDAQGLVKLLEQKLSREWVASAVAFAMRQVPEQASLRDVLERLVQMQLYNWEQIESVIYSQLILTVEQLLPYPGKFQFDSQKQLNFCRGVELSKLMLDITQRQEQWNNFKPTIMSMDAVPNLKSDTLANITEPNIRKHLQEWVNGQRSLVDIAEGLNKDPLSITKSYANWIQAGWLDITNNNTTTTQISLSTVLAVDDSAVMQQLIKRALTGYCQVILASNAVDALNVIYHEKISLLLLDVSMPEIDGLELCRTVRSIPQFRDLPIIMVTARDGFFDKVKGKFAGSNDYLTKPFDAEQLRQIVGRYIGLGISFNNKDAVTFDLSNQG
ncbi:MULTISPECIES: response regulator [Chroococcidiopsis]|jgi:CheY-like chemotaxis protein|uniref:Response regulator receiver protein n=1 Tax=Chroococcidiopsis thermalis (strain PCC 7203) TaxID=251229 RepID=K9TTR4_CHRTP|nr:MULTISPECIES: response regulator [Chroococcidiopsis]AFY85571.1 response regulator receiver protein [Chroococcidiopsis thermalis PCC 7203]PSB44667.1 response regulator [Cyanosarcina cf. burmensis CCALA 770]URD50413.1 response regulator [Chroococcidiopsis sp. CCNUC1]